MKRLIVAEDNYLVREGIRRLLEDDGTFHIIAAVATAPALLEAVDRELPDVVLTDIRMPPTFSMDGIEVALAIRRRHPGVGVVVLSQHADASYASTLFGEGTTGLAYLLKERVGDREELVRALDAVGSGGSVVDPLVVDELVASARRAEASPLRGLTQRELDVLREMAQGRANPAIAERLFVSESAVSKHVAAIFAKLGLLESRGIDRRVSAVLAYVGATGSSAAR